MAAYATLSDHLSAADFLLDIIPNSVGRRLAPPVRTRGARHLAVNPFFGGGAYPSQPAPGFGQYTQAASPRQMQVAARLAF